MTTTIKPVEGDGWYERRDGTVAEYRWTGGLLVEVRAVASWAEVAQVKRDDELLLAAKELDRCYAEAEAAAPRPAPFECGGCGDLNGLRGPHGRRESSCDFCGWTDEDEHGELRRAALNRGRP